MTDFFDAHARTEDEELVRIYETGPEGLREREICPDFFPALLERGLIETHGPEHYTVSRRGRIYLEQHHLLR